MTTTAHSGSTTAAGIAESTSSVRKRTGQPTGRRRSCRNAAAHQSGGGTTMTTTRRLSGIRRQPPVPWPD